MPVKTPWAILRCKWNDLDDEPLSNDYVANLFTTAGAGSNNMVDFFETMSHGNLDLSGSQVFGWFTLPRPQIDSPAYLEVNRKALSQDELVALAFSTATANGVPLQYFPYRVVMMNTFQGILFGHAGNQVAVCDGGNCWPSLLGQEMGHAYVLDHSRRAGSLADYQDNWDVMSTLSGCYMEPGGPYGLYGPGLNAANMRGRGWLDRSRVLSLDVGEGGSTPRTVQLRPLHARELPGYLALEFGNYIIEFRDKHTWDVAIPEAAVFVHSFSENHSYIERNTDGGEQVLVGDSWELDLGPDLPSTKVVVDDIDTSSRTATLTVTNRPGRKFSVPVGGDSGLQWVDGGGFLGGSARQSIPVRPGDELVDVVDHLVAFKSVENLRYGPARDAVQRTAMERLAQYAEAQLGRLNADIIRTPAPLAPGRELERPLVQSTTSRPGS